MYLALSILLQWSFSLPSCEDVKPFAILDTLHYKLEITRSDKDEVFCKGKAEVHFYDIRGREEEAYFCLKPKENEVTICKKDGIEVQFVPHVLWRKWQEGSRYDYNFHAYILKEKEPGFSDIFSRVLLKEATNNIILEGAYRKQEMFHVRMEIEKH